MNRNIYTFNNLLRAYNRYRRKLANLRKANKNVRRQGILQNHIDRLFKRLTVLNANIKLSTVAASVAIGTLAFAPQTAQGQIAFAPAQTNPFGLTNIGSAAAPTFADLDNDGDLDMLSGEIFGNFRYFQNTGTATAPVFALAQTNPFGLTGIGTLSPPTFADLDNDGDLDMLSGELYGDFFYFENTGTATAPAFVLTQTNPFGLTNIGGFSSTPTFADLDNDGDLDMLSGELYGNFIYFENTGTATAPAFVLAQTNPFGLTGIGSFSAPTFADLDNDGDMDMMTGEYNGNFIYFQNTGTASAPVFAAVQTNPFDLASIGNFSFPTFADLDNDGDLDIMAGERVGNFFYFQNTSTTLSVIENDFGDAIKVYPNPTEDILIISTRSTMVSVSLHNMLGQEVLNRKVNTNEEQIDVSLLAKGTYIVKILTEDNKVKTSKLIKE